MFSAMLLGAVLSAQGEIKLNWDAFSEVSRLAPVYAEYKEAVHALDSSRALAGEVTTRLDGISSESTQLEQDLASCREQHVAWGRAFVAFVVQHHPVMTGVAGSAALFDKGAEIAQTLAKDMPSDEVLTKRERELVAQLDALIARVESTREQTAAVYASHGVYWAVQHSDFTQSRDQLLATHSRAVHATMGLQAAKGLLLMLGEARQSAKAAVKAAWHGALNDAIDADSQATLENMAESLASANLRWQLYNEVARDLWRRDARLQHYMVDLVLPRIGLRFSYASLQRLAELEAYVAQQPLDEHGRVFVGSVLEDSKRSLAAWKDLAYMGATRYLDEDAAWRYDNMLGLATRSPARDRPRCQELADQLREMADDKSSIEAERVYERFMGVCQ